MKIALLGISLLAPAMLWAQDDAVLASAETEMKMVESLAPTPPPPPPARIAPTLIAVPGKAGADAGAYVTFVEGRGDCQRGQMAIAIKNVSDKPVIALVEMAMYYSYHNMARKDIRVDNLGAGEIRNLGCKGSVETATSDTHSNFKIKAAMFK